MTHRERVLTALNHEIPDRCPMQISFTPEFARRLKADLRLQGRSFHNPHGGGNTYELERMLGQDMLLTSVGWANSYYAGEDAYTDEWGVGWRQAVYRTPYGEGRYTEIASHPLADEREVSSYKAPDPCRPELYNDSRQTVADFSSTHFIVGVTVTTIFETAWALRGYEQLMEDMLLDPDLADAVLEIPFRYHLEAAKQLAALGVDMIWCGDDMGAQHSMIISPQLWRRFFKPRMAEFIASVKAVSPGILTAYHSDGWILPIIPDLVEIGLDVLNPVQPASMDPEQLKRNYGSDLSFWGSIDEQYTLPMGTPGEVRREVEQRISTLGRGGGLILGPTHHVQLDTPMENFRAMVDAIRSTPYPG